MTDESGWSQDWRAVAKAVAGKLGGKWEWEPFGPDGYVGTDQSGRSVIMSQADHDGHGEWIHASVARTDRLPSYHDLVGLHAAIWPNGFAYQIFASSERHVSIHDRALHLWGRSDGANVLPDFGAGGTI